MKPGVLIIVTADPRTSARAAEAVRIAAGVGAWQGVAVTLYLRDAAVLALGEFTDELVDEEIFRRHLPDLAATGQPIYLQADNPLRKKLGASPVKHAEMNDAQLAVLAAQNQYVLRF